MVAEGMVNSLPTPIARVLVRAYRVSELDRAERFNSLQYVAEVFIKYTALMFHSMIAVLDIDSWQYWGYRLARADSNGVWEDALTNLHNAAIRRRPPADFQHILFWWSNKRTGANATIWSDEAFQLVQELWELTQSSPVNVHPSIRGLIGFLVAFRNKTRGHGAFTAQFYEAANPQFLRLLEQILGQADPLRMPLTWCEPQEDGVYIRKLAGPAPMLGRRSTTTAPTSGLFIETGGQQLPFSPLMRYAPDSDSCRFANGGWQSNRSACETLDYVTGDVDQLVLKQFATPPTPLQRSETSGGSTLIEGSGAYHNLPLLPEGYVQRRALEDRLTELLSDARHRIVTLHGMGGVGKTSLALYVAAMLAKTDPSRFDFILWFSARDVDLLLSGPQQRQQDVNDLQDIATRYCRMMDCPEAGADAQALFVSEVSSTRNRILLIMDNFETIADPEGVHEYLDNTVTLPNKVLITSRLRAFRGDYPLEVRGMEPTEARELLLRESRRAGCEPRMDDRAITTIYDYTRGAPYAMKLVAAQLGRNLPLSQIVDRSLADDAILDALFLRAYRALNSDARRLFLLVGNISRDISTVPIRSIFASAGMDYGSALDDCERWSLIEVVESDDQELLKMPQVARKFATRQLNTAEEQISIEQNLQLLKRTFVGDRHHDVAAEWAAKIGDMVGDLPEGSERDELTNLLKSLAREFPASWRVLATVRMALNSNVDEVREAYEMAVQYEPHNSAVWQEWANFERRWGSERREVELLLKAAECAPDNVGLNSHAAWRLSHLIRADPEFRVDRDSFKSKIDLRRQWIEPIRRNLEGQFESLNASPLARLGWLYLSLNDRANAERCAKRGLSLEPEHEHCLNIIDALARRSER